MSRYDKIAQGLNSCYTEKAKKRMAERAELQFNQSNEAYESALKSKDAQAIEKVVNALIKQREALYAKIFQNNGKNEEDIVAYNQLTAKLQKLEMHVEQLHSEGEI